MTLGIITSIQQSNAYQNYVAGSAPERWAGRSVEIIGAASAVVSPYFRSKWISIPTLTVSIVAAAILGAFVADEAKKLAPRKVEKVVIALSFAGTWVTTVYAISKFAGLPFGKWGSIVGGTLALGFAISAHNS